MSELRNKVLSTLRSGGSVALVSKDDLTDLAKELKKEAKCKAFIGRAETLNELADIYLDHEYDQLLLSITKEVMRDQAVDFDMWVHTSDGKIRAICRGVLPKRERSVLLCQVFPDNYVVMPKAEDSSQQ